MMHRIQTVEAKNNFVFEAVFYNGQIVQYDTKRLFTNFPQFQAFQSDKTLFYNIRVDEGGYGVSWNDEFDLDAETVWEGGILLEKRNETDLNHLLAYQLLSARENTGITQKELAAKTGIYQADISKLKRGIGNPSLLTLKRLAEGLDLKLQINFVKK